MPSKIKGLMAFRLDTTTLLMLRSWPYSKYKGKLIRMLFKAYFNNELPALKFKFETEIAREQQQSRATGSK